MPILVALIALIALVYGAVRAFAAIEASFGLTVAVVVAAIVVFLLIAALVYWWQRRQAVAPNIHDGDWTHELKGDWGAVRLAAGKRLCEIRLGEEQGSYIFADLVGAEPIQRGGHWLLDVKVKDRKRQEWSLPMSGERQANQWQRIFLLAIAQKL